VGYQNRGIFRIATIFDAFYEQRLNCVFTVHAIRTAHSYLIIVTYTLHLSENNILSSALVIKDCCYYRHCHSHDFCSQTNRFRYCSVVHWSKIYKRQSRQKSTLKLRWQFFKNRIEIDQKYKSRIVTTLIIFISFQLM